MYEQSGNRRNVVYFQKMPKCTYTAELVVGYILAKMEQMRRIIHRLENQIEFSRQELEHIRTDLQEIATDVDVQVKMVRDDRMGAKLIEYRMLLNQATQQRARRLEALDKPAETMLVQLQFGEVDVAMVDGPPRQAENVEADQDTMSLYASDNEEPLPLELMSVVKPAPTFEPVRIESADDNEPQPSTSRQADLREQLARHQAVASYGVQRDVREQGRGAGVGHRRGSGRWNGQTRIFVPSRTPEQGRSSNQSRSDTATSRSSMSSHASYVWSRQECFDEPIRGRTYPPVLREPPTPLVRKDPKLIGMAEVFTHPPQANPKICPICPGGRHKMYRCPVFQRMGLQEKWYTVLKKGVCLHCLIRGHSHFTCDTPGACWRCGTRHNSKLCPKGPSNE